MATLKKFDTAFWGEVLVPTKPCSLGYCAGLKVGRSLKGTIPDSTIVRVAGPGQTDHCGPKKFNKKGERWLVFANRGTSPQGQTYLDVDQYGPTFQAEQLLSGKFGTDHLTVSRWPNFTFLDQRYQALRSRLDAAITGRLPTRRY